MFENKTHSYRKLLSVILTIVLVVTVIPFSFSANALDGDGTVGNPYTISTYQDLKDFANKINSGNTGVYGKLTANIEISESWTPIANYTGIFDGDNHTITYGTGFGFSANSNGVYGLFAINRGTIKNLTISGNVTVTISTDLDFAGSIAGANFGTIENCKNSVNFVSSAKNANIGGISAVSSGTITSCQNSGTITIYTHTTEGSFEDQQATAGGIVALNEGGTVEKCTNSGVIKNSDTYGYAGGIVGSNYSGEINNCLNTDSVSNENAPQFAAGITGLLYTQGGGATATIENSLDTNTEGKFIGTNCAGTYAGVISNCYYVGTGNDGIEGIEKVTNDDLTSGDVTYKLNGNTYIDPVWYQIINTDQTPILEKKDDGIVYKNSSEGYTNTKTTCSSPHTYDENGICPVCGTPIAYVGGYTVTADGTIGLNYYYYIDPDYTSNTISVKYSVEGRTGTVLFNQNDTKVDNNITLYKFQIPVYSDEMTSEVTTTINIVTDTTTYSLSKEYSVAEYLMKLLDTSSDNNLKALAKSMLTYDYYAYKYFNSTTYNPEVSLDTLESKSNIQNAISAVTGNVQNPNASTGDNSILKNYSTALTLQSTIMCQFGAQEIGNGVDDTIYMRYVENGRTFSNEQPVVARPQSNFCIADTAGIAPAELDTLYDVQFGTYDNGTFTPLTTTKIAGPYTYINSVLNAYEATEGTITSGKEDLVNLVKSLYGYSNAAKAYFSTVQG